MRPEAELQAYDYQLPPELIAQKPASPRETARLLVYQKGQTGLGFDTFAHLGKYLPKNAVLVLNQTRVIPARLALAKPTGGKVQMLYVSHGQGLIKALANKKLDLGLELKIPGTRHGLTVVKKQDQFYYFKPNFPVGKITTVLGKHGQMPLPPYIKHSPLTEKQKRTAYQSVFAKNGASVAAPTASLHFPKKLLQQLKKQGISIKFITLNVSLGTFAPLTGKQLETGKLHMETYHIPAGTLRFLNQAKKQGRPIIAVGTTVVRTLESASRKHQLARLSGQTDLFIRPGYKFQFINGLVTNFHVPKSSLMMLVAALTGKTKLLRIYKTAVKLHFRFFSFGDGMLVLP